jgi:hypothetical protein
LSLRVPLSLLLYSKGGEVTKKVIGHKTVIKANKYLRKCWHPEWCSTCRS